MAKIVIVKPKKQKTCPKRLDFHRITPKLIAQALVILAVFGVFIFALPTLPQTPSNVANAEYKGVINLWLVDSFEGGSGSRKGWFTTRSAYYEKQNKGLFVCVTGMTESQLLDNLNSGQTFDILCFSRGVGSRVADILTPLDVDCGKVLDNFAIAGKLKNTTYALPVYAGAYCLFARSNQQTGHLIADSLSATFTRKVGKNIFHLQPLTCGFTSSNSPLSALAMAGAKGKVTPNYQLSQYTAYEQFVANKTAVTLLGTQRDLFRLLQKLDMGKIDHLLFAPLSNYNDLVQFVGVHKDTEKLAPCLDFITYLLSDTVQQSLTNISMFSVTNQNLYTNEWYSLCEKGLADAFVPNLFADEQSIDNQRQTAVDTLLGG